MKSSLRCIGAPVFTSSGLCFLYTPQALPFLISRQYVRRQHFQSQQKTIHRPLRDPTPPRQITLVAKDPARFDKQCVIEALTTDFFHRNLRNLQWPGFTHLVPGCKTNHAIVILATPRYVAWLEDYAEFIPQVLTHFKRSLLSRTREKASVGAVCDPTPITGTDPNWHFDIICACVDGLATHIRPQKGVLVEGLSFIHGRTSSIAPDLWNHEPIGTEEIPMQSSLTFTSDGTSNTDTLEHHAVTLPLANTLFTNGKISTLVSSRWQYESDWHFTKLKMEEKANQKIVALNSFGAFQIPAITLTPPRRISSGLGNIVRQLECEEKPFPASEELEASIDAYLKKTQQHKSTVQVWALIIPVKAFPKGQLKTFRNLLSTEEEFTSFWEDPAGVGFVGTPGHWIKKGATFCRVLSGGGGWGAKKGLLSLDPQTTYGAPAEPDMGYFGDLVDEQQISALGNLASPDSYVQFFAANSAERNEESPSGLTRRNIYRPRSTALLGTVPSTIDNVPEPPKAPQPSVEEPIISCLGHFGAVSESGLFVDTKWTGNKAVNTIRTKLDLPYSTLAWNFSSPARRSHSPRKVSA